jgi:hypothetical protein
MKTAFWFPQSHFSEQDRPAVGAARRRLELLPQRHKAAFHFQKRLFTMRK